jgi:signal transduction histidine kinase
VLVDSDADILRLQTALRDLVALSAIPAAWTGKEPSAVAAGFADALLELLQLDFAFVRLSDPGRTGEVDVTRGTAWATFTDWLEGHLATGEPVRKKEIVPDLGDSSEARRGLVIPVGFNGDKGLIAVASSRNDFPTEMEDLLLSLATNQAATAFQNARSEEELRRGRDELELKVAERTAELGQLAQEQAALRRVATLVARGITPEEVFQAVAAEVGVLFGSDVGAIIRFEEDQTVTVLGDVGGPHKAGKRVTLDPGYVVDVVRETSRSARFDTDDPAAPDMPSLVRALGIRSALASPIVVQNELWGAITIASLESPLALGAERRLTEFTELVATAVANTQAREEVMLLADEQAALRRVAEFVARGIAPEEVFQAVAAEVGVVFGSDTGAIVRFEDDQTVTVLGAATGPLTAPHEVGTRVTLDPGSAVDVVRETGRSARFDTNDPGAPDMPSLVQALGIRSAVASPIVVQGELWGAITTASLDGPLPLGAERRLTEFTELVATAVANTQAREEVTTLAEEQAALRRVATLVARGAASEDIFAAAVNEVAGLLRVASATMGRFEGDDSVTIVASWSSTDVAFRTGVRWPTEGTNIAWIVLQSGQAARIDDFSAATDPIGVAAREAGYKSAAGSPIVVEGHVWGLVTVTSAEGPLPPDTEARLSSFTELVATAIANAEGRSALAASRRRIVAASDETRRRIERDIHDGTQQRLVSLGLAIRAAEADLPSDSRKLRDELGRIAIGLADAVADLQELSRGIHPAILSRGGLGPALRELALRSPIPVHLDIPEDGRFPEPIEVAAYFVASETLANAAKHSQATGIEIRLIGQDARLELSVRDDGVGGADPTNGSGLLGLADRVEALGGSIDVRSDMGRGTQVTADLPLEDRV